MAVAVVTAHLIDQSTLLTGDGMTNFVTLEQRPDLAAQIHALSAFQARLVQCNLI